MLLYQISAYTIHGKKIKKSRKNNKFKITCKADLKRSDKYVVSSNLAYNTHGKKIIQKQ